MATSSRGSGGSGAGVRSSAREARPAPAPPPSSAKVRKAIVRVLAPDKHMTPDEIQRAVAGALPAARSSIDQQLGVLRDGEYVTEVEGDARKLALTDSGLRWSRGIVALSPQSADR
jgi:hypothetical protein